LINPEQTPQRPILSGGECLPSKKSAVMADCRECKQPLVEIDNRAMYLTGCMTCNIWWTNEGEKVRLSEAYLRALHAMRRTR
jgi:hypothetical protein